MTHYITIHAFDKNSSAYLSDSFEITDRLKGDVKEFKKSLPFLQFRLEGECLDEDKLTKKEKKWIKDAGIKIYND